MPRRSRNRAYAQSVRIIAGTWRGRRLTFPRGTAVRPTPDRVRETLFNWLREDVEGARCLDLYAGTGALGLEALSRGAREAVLVESDGALAGALEANARMLAANARIVRATAERFVDRPTDPFDIVFLDPPYAVSLEPIIARLPTLLRANGLVYVERAARDGLPKGGLLEWRKSGHAGAVSYGLATLAA
ncbi:MAG TPA: 16S rRNA (guanine(966)-N(2))-methyltransferase RsmD [Gammaproteobacteria bacterium]|jgi:16S rRNA (guanine966-N2)-methyltransferase